QANTESQQLSDGCCRGMFRKPDIFFGGPDKHSPVAARHDVSFSLDKNAPNKGISSIQESDLSANRANSWMKPDPAQEFVRPGSGSDQELLSFDSPLFCPCRDNPLTMTLQPLDALLRPQLHATFAPC